MVYFFGATLGVAISTLNVERVTGIEPVFPAWEAGIIPLYDTRTKLLLRMQKANIQSFYNTRMPTALYHYLVRQQRPAVFAAGLFCATLIAVFTAPSVRAESALRHLDSATISRGFTLVSDNKNAALAVWAGAVKEEVTVRLEALPAAPLPLPIGTTLASDAWVFDVLKTDTAVKDPLTVMRPITLALRHGSPTLFQKRLYFWDANAGTWRPMPSSTDARGFVRGTLRLPYAIVAAFDEHDAVEGKASWFRHRLGDTAASNDFPMGSKLRVTDIASGKKVNVIVRSTGPFVSGRVVDLASSAFKKIHPLWQGVAVVRVELLST